MSYLDIFIALPLVWGLYKGIKKGIIGEAVSLAAFISGIYGAVKFSGIIGNYIRQHFEINVQYLGIVVFIIIFVLIILLVRLLGKVMEGIVKLLLLDWVNKLIGALFGIFKWGLIISTIFLLLNAVSKDGHFFSASTRQGSLLYQPIATLVPQLIPAAKLMNW